VTLERFRLVAPDRAVADATLELHGAVRTFPIEFAIADRASRRVEAHVVLKRSDFAIGAPASRWNPLSIDDDVVVRVAATVPEPEAGRDDPAAGAPSGSGEQGG
jgi:hypothetical protein